MIGRWQRGFTLLEMLVALVIGVLLVTLVPPLLSGLGGGVELRSAARQLAAGLRSARNQAVTRQQEAVLTLDLAQHRFGVSGDPRVIALPNSVAFNLYTAQSELLDQTTGNIRFFPDGSSTGGAITVSNPKIAYRINVDWLTGAVDIVEQGAPP
ncbi:MAG: GspH/FimT family pseudopilin [Candidatus Contendobacter sp.]|nr:GspH/FimT family pseudopilin [Candidatus Contendobacter sp.]RUQ32999.1 MAG: type II secretion system protein GspH [Candidatus Competibacteraceae bacterium]